MHYNIKNLGIHILAFLVARCQLFGVYPFVIPFFMGAYLQERSSIGIFLSLMLGIASTLQFEAVVKYGIVIIFVLTMLEKTDRTQIFENRLQIAIASGACLFAISMPYQYLVTRKDSSLLYSLFDAVLAICFVIVFEKAFQGFRVGTSRMFADNERYIGIFLLFAVALFGCPLISTPINILFIICSYILLYSTHRFESGVGIATGSMVGFVLAIRLEHMSYLPVMILISFLLLLLKELGKIGIVITFLSGMILFGFFYDSTLLKADLLRSLLFVVLGFALIPIKGGTYKKNTVSRNAQEILVQEATKSRIQNFGQAFLEMERMMKLHETNRAMHLEDRYGDFYINGNELSLLNAVESQTNRLEDLRKNLIRQIGQIGENIISFQGSLMDESVKIEYFEKRLMNRLEKKGVIVTKVLPLKNNKGIMEVYINCYSDGNQLITGGDISKLLSQILWRSMICMNREKDVVSNEDSFFRFIEEGKYLLTTGLVRKNRDGENMCGDSFSITKLDAQKAVLMISDGMGSGEEAYVKSEQVMNLIENLLEAGFCSELAIDLLNAFISFIEDGMASSTLDLTMVDFYTGDTDFVKLGASTTFIKREGKVECIRSTSLPVGILEKVEFDTCARKLYHGDIIVMISDGIMDGIIFEDKEAYLADFISNLETNNAQKIAELIMQDVEYMQHGKMRDDSTVLVAGVWQRQ